MTKMRAIARLAHDSGLPRDEVVNVWHFDSDQTFGEDADDTASRLLTFYQAIDDQILGAQLQGGITIDMYNLEEAPPRVPGYTLTGTLVPNSASAKVPEEVACCLSFAGASGSGVNMKRRRGRVYLGPLASQIITADTHGTYISPSYTAIIAAAAADLAHGPDPGDARLAVFSPTTARAVDGWSGATSEPPGGFSDGALDAAFEDVVSGWVDNAFDIQRRRGVRSTARAAWTPT